MGKLNKSLIDRLVGKTQDKQLELADGNNLYLMVTKIGSCKFKYRIRKNNKASWIALGDYPAMSLDDARQEALQFKTMVKTGIDPVLIKQQEKNKHMLFSQFVQLYIQERLPIVRKSINSANNFIRVMESHVIPLIGDYYLVNIDDNAIKKVMNAKTSLGKYGIARLIRAMLKVLLDYAVEKELIIKNPVGIAKTYNMTASNSRSRFLTDKEIATMMQLIYPSPIIKIKYKIAIHLLLMLLMRKTELIHATWEQLDFEKETFTITTSKMGSQLVIPLPKQAIALFRIMQELSQNSNYIFTGTTDNLPVHEHTLNKQSTIINYLMFSDNKSQYFTIHDLRRTGATHLGELGYPSDYIEVALNHTKGGIKQVYQRSQFIEQRKEMLQKWANKLDSLISQELLPYGK